MSHVKATVNESLHDNMPQHRMADRRGGGGHLSNWVAAVIAPFFISVLQTLHEIHSLSRPAFSLAAFSTHASGRSLP